MVNPNKYLSFIEHCSKKKYHTNEYLEKHHITPKHEGGTDDAYNLIRLSLKDHRTAHKIRYEMYGNKYDLSAYNFMMGQTKEAKRLICSANGSKSKGKKLTKEHREKLSRPGSLNSFHGKTHSKESREKMRQKAIGRKWKEETKEKLSNTLKNNPLITGSRRCEIKGRMYKSCTEAANSLGLKKNTLSYRLNSKNYQDYVWLDSSRVTKRNRQALHVLIDGIEYRSINHAGCQLGIHPSTVSKRCNDPAYKNYQLL